MYNLIQDRLELLDLLKNTSCHLAGTLSMLDFMKVIFNKFIKDNENNKLLVDKVYGNFGLIFNNLKDSSDILRNKNKDIFYAGENVLNHTLGIAAGLAYSDKISNYFILMGDSSLSNGNVYESLINIGYNNFNNIILLIDCNNRGARNEELKYNIKFIPFFDSLNWNCKIINGHNIHKIYNAINNIIFPLEKPLCLIFNTIKGYLIDEDMPHYINLNDDLYNKYKNILLNNLHKTY
jgi:transketolase N-terminal domain/subunit